MYLVSSRTCTQAGMNENLAHLIRLSLGIAILGCVGNWQNILTSFLHHFKKKKHWRICQDIWGHLHEYGKKQHYFIWNVFHMSQKNITLCPRLAYMSISPRSGKSRSARSSTSSNDGEFVQLMPLQSPHTTEHSSPYFRHVQRLELQSVLQLHLMTFSRESGAGGRSVVSGSSRPDVPEFGFGGPHCHL